MIINKPLYTTTELANILKVSNVTIFKRIKSGKIRAQKIGRNYLIPRSELELLNIKIDTNKKNIIIPEIKLFIEDTEKLLKNTIFLKDGKTVMVKHDELFKTRIDINEKDILVGFNEPHFKKSIDTTTVFDLDSPLNARLLTYFLPAVQIAKMQNKRPRLIIVTGINAALKYNAQNEQERKILYRNNMIKLRFVQESLEKFFPNVFSIIEIRLAYDFMKIPEEQLDQLWKVFIKRYPNRMKPLTDNLAKFSNSGDLNIKDEKKLKEAFRYAILHLFAMGDVNLDYDFIHSNNGYCSIGEHQELTFNIVREIGYEILKDIGEIVFGREVHCYKNSKIIIDDEGHVPPPYNGAFRSNGDKNRIDEVTYENNYNLSYYDERPRLKSYMDYLYKIIPKKVYEQFWDDYKIKYFELKERYNEAYQILS